MYFCRKPFLPLIILCASFFLLFSLTGVEEVVAEEASISSTVSSTVASNERGRVRIVANNVVTDQGDPLRGEHLVFGTGANDTDTDSTILYDDQFWRTLRDEYHLNTVRLMLSRPPQNWSAELGDECAPPAYRCYPLDYVHSGNPQANGKTTLEIMDDLVGIAGRLGMYIIIDYHPVFGYDMADATAWWARVAPRYADRTHVLYEVANEPYPNTGYPADVIDFQETLYGQIRAAAPNTHIILWTFPLTDTDLGSTVTRASQISYENASVGYHPYGEYNSANLTALRAQYPIIATEIGQNRVDMTNEAESINASWIWLDGAALKPGLESTVDNYLPNDIAWPRDPFAVDQGGAGPTPTPNPTATPTLISTPISTPNATPTPTPTPILNATSTPNPSCGPLTQEAEDGILSGSWIIGSDGAASGGSYITVPDADAQVAAADVNPHRARYCFGVTTPGIYRILGWAYAQDHRDNSLFVTVDGRPSSGYTWDIEVNTSYKIDYINDRNGADPVEIFLSQGNHIIKFFMREDGVRLDKVALASASQAQQTNTPAPPTATATSTPIATPIATNVPSNCGASSQEAEGGALFGNMQLWDDLNASFGEYVANANITVTSSQYPSVFASAVNRKHRADYCVTIGEAGEYRLKARAYAPDGRGNSFFVQIDGAPAAGILWDLFPANGTYVNRYVSDRGGSGASTFNLSAGDHTISFISREIGTRLDSFVLESASLQSAAIYDPTRAEVEENLAFEKTLIEGQATTIYLPVTIE